MKPSFTTRPYSLDGLAVFIAVARRGSFRQAAVDLGISPSAVSQAIRALESRVGAVLLTRTTRSVGLTDAGLRLFERVGPAWAEMTEAIDEARDVGGRIAGRLRIATPRAAVTQVLMPIVTAFCAAYPDVEVEVAASEVLTDLARDGFDAGLRMGQFIQEDMIVVRLTPAFRLSVVGTPAYFAQHPAPRSPADLAAHRCLRQRRSDGSLAPWRFMQGGQPLDVAVKGPFIGNDFPTLLQAALAGIGIAQVPGPIAMSSREDGRLVEVLERFAVQSPGVFLYYPSRHQVSPRLRAFIDVAKRRAQSDDLARHGAA